MRKILGNSLKSFPGISAEISSYLSRENLVKMSTEIGDFLENFQWWTPFSGRGWTFSCDYFKRIYQNQFWGISCNPFQGISRNPFKGISCNPFLGISCNQFQGISDNPFWGISCNPFQGISRNPFRGISPNPFRGISRNQLQEISLENNWRKCQSNLGKFLGFSRKKVLYNQFLWIIPYIFPRVPQKYSLVNSLIRT